MSEPYDSARQLAERGIVIPHPSTVEIDPSVKPELIGAGTVIHAGCRIRGERTSIGPGCVLGEEEPVTLVNCRLGERVSLRGGYFAESVFLDRVSIGAGAHVRPGCILEEEVAAGHAVGLKQTILMPFVTLGSLINFCDCLMAGGASRRNHSEVGSSYVHFNFTPHQDKATASLIGDVPRGVMLDQPPIFLGGQGGLVGPRFIEFGTVVAAGTICRRDITEPGLLVFGDTGQHLRERPYTPGLYGDISRIIAANLRYIGNIHALAAWYEDVRSRFAGDRFSSSCVAGALSALKLILAERLARMDEFAEKVARSAEAARGRPGSGGQGDPAAMQREFAERWPVLRTVLAEPPVEGETPRLRDQFLNFLSAIPSQSTYIEAVRSLPRDAKIIGVAWLDSVVDSCRRLW